MAKDRKATVSWNSVKAGLRNFDRTALLGLVQDLYAASKDNQAFLHARLNLGGDPLKPFKAVISRWVCPDIFKNQPVSVSKAKKAIADYKKAIGQPEGMAELSVFYCEEAIAFLRDCGMEDEGYYSALVLMFEQALKWVMTLPEDRQKPFLERLGRVAPPAGKSAGVLARKWPCSGATLRAPAKRMDSRLPEASDRSSPRLALVPGSRQRRIRNRGLNGH